MRNSLGRRAFAIALSSILPFACVLTFNEYRLRLDREVEVNQIALRTAEQASIEMDRLLGGIELTLRAVSKAPGIIAFETERCGRYIANLKDVTPQLTAILVLDLTGSARCGPDNTSLPDIVKEDYFRNAISARGELALGSYTVGRLSGRPVLPMALAILDQAGEPVGVVVSGLDLRWLGTSLRDYPLAHRASLTVSDQNGTIIAREPYPERFIGTQIPTNFMKLLSAQSAGTIDVVSQDNTTRILGYVPLSIKPKGLYISAGIARDEAFASINAATLRNLISGVCGLVLAILLSWYLGRKLLRGPVQRISATLSARRAGDSSRRTGMKAEDGDLEALGAEFDAYMDELNRNKLEQERAEEHRTLLAQELSHRVKNLIATIQAIAHQSFNGQTRVKDAMPVFDARLSAIANAQQVLLFDRSEPATLREAVNSSISLFESLPGDRFKLSGDDLAIRSEAALTFAMAIHELCTNAVKYGALSKDGHVNIDWNANDQTDTFLLTWTEMGGPPVDPPSRKGFGSKMIERILTSRIGGSATMSFHRSGLECVVQAPLSAVRDRVD